MGNLIVFKSTLRAEMEPYSELSLAAVRKLVRRFDSLQTSFGWGIGLETFASLFRLDPTAPLTRTLWSCWDTDANGVTDALEILSSLTVISRGTFEDKLDACFRLFDFDESETLTSDEMAICVRTTVCGLCKLLGMEEPPMGDIDRLSAKAFTIVGVGSKRITKAQFATYVACTPTVIATVCRFGTTNADATKRRFAQLMAEDKAAQKIQAAFKRSKSQATSSSSVAARIDSRRRHDDPVFQAFDYNPHDVRRARHVFDQIDADGSGEISARELVTSMVGQEFIGAAVGAFRAIDVDGSGTLTFDEMLRVLYPHARPQDIKLMIRETQGSPIDRETIIAMQLWFESHDDDFDGKIVLLDVVDGLLADEAFRPYLVGYVPPPKLAAQPIGFLALLEEIFPAPKFKLQQILEWSRVNGPVHQLDAKQQAELETLFALYDPDATGFIPMAELKTHFQKMGFAEDETARLFAKYDADAEHRVDLLEFKKFYRNVWATTARMASPHTTRPSTTHERASVEKSREQIMEEEYR